MTLQTLDLAMQKNAIEVAAKIVALIRFGHHVAGHGLAFQRENMRGIRGV